MDKEPGSPVIPELHDSDAQYPLCPDCEQPFKPGHQCREMMIDQAVRMRAAFQVSIKALGEIRNMLILWPRGGENKRLHEVSAVARKALGEVKELLDFTKGVANGS